MTIAVRIIDRALVGEGLGDPHGPRPCALGTNPDCALPHTNAQTPKWGLGQHSHGAGGERRMHWCPAGFAQRVCSVASLGGRCSPSQCAAAAWLFPPQRTWA